MTVYPPQPRSVDDTKLNTLSALPAPSTIPSDDFTRTLHVHGTDTNRAVLPISVNDASGGQFLNISVNDFVCGTAETVSGWSPNGELGGLCVGVADGTSGAIATIEAWIKLPTQTIKVIGEDLIRFDSVWTTTAIQTDAWTGESATKLFGWSASPIDVDSDGNWEVLVGSNGSLALLNGLGGGLLQKIESGAGGAPTFGAGDEFGSSLAYLELEDGASDETEVAVGARSSGKGGAVYILGLGSDGAVGSSLRIGSEENGGPVLQDGENFGSSVAWVKNFGGVGYTGLLVGADGFDEVVVDGDDDVAGNATVVEDVGKVYVLEVRSSGALEVNTIQPVGLQAGDRFGASMAWFGDGGRNVAIGAPFADVGGENRGGMYLGSIGEDGTFEELAFVASEQNGGPVLVDGARFGSAIAFVSDLDFDGQFELAVAAPGDRRVYILTVTSSQVLTREFSLQESVLYSDFATALVWLGDFPQKKSGIEHTLAISTPSNWSLNLYTLPDFSDASSIPQLVLFDTFAPTPYKSPISTLQTSTPFIPLHPHVTDFRLRFALVSPFFNASNTIQSFDILVAGRPCHQSIILPSWGSAANSRRIGVECVVPDHESATTGTISISFESPSSPTIASTITVNYENLLNTPVSDISKFDTNSIANLDLEPNDGFGHAIAYLGELDQRFLEYFAVGAPDYGDFGSVFLLAVDGKVFRNQSELTSGRNGVPSLLVGDRFGSSVVGVGDLNLDGVGGDFLVGAEGVDSDSGAVFVFATLADLTVYLLNTLKSSSGGASTILAGDMFGKSMARIGDFDGSGRGVNIVVGQAAGYRVFSFEEIGYGLEVHVQSGGSVPTQSIVSGDLFGAAVVGARGEGDFLVGAPQTNSGEGAVFYITIGSSGTVSSASKIAPNSPGGPTTSTSANFGISLAWIGDAIGGESVPSVVAVGAVNDIDATEKGVVHLLSIDAEGGSSVLGKFPSTSNDAGTGFGLSLASSTFDGISTGLANTMLVGAKDDSIGGSIYLVQFNDLTDISSTQKIYGPGTPTSKNLPLLRLSPPKNYYSAPSLDPRALDTSRSVLPFSILTNTPNASTALKLHNITINSNPCTSSTILSSWPKSTNTRWLGVACIGVPEGNSAESVNVTITLQDFRTEKISTFTSSSIAVYDDLAAPYITSPKSSSSIELPTGSNFGTEIDLIGDLDGDGSMEFVIGAGSEDGNLGAVYVVSVDASSGEVGLRSRISSGNGIRNLEEADGQVNIGRGLAWIGDVNGDGSAHDIAVGASNYGADDPGGVFILSINATGHSTELSLIASGLNGMSTLLNGDEFGFKVSWIGDVDGDGLSSDIAVGATNDDMDGVSAGAVYILTLDEDAHVKSSTKLGELASNRRRVLRENYAAGSSSTGSNLGGSLLFLGDVIGNGNSKELLIGAPTYSSTKTHEGAVAIYSIPSTPSDATEFSFVASGVNNGPILGEEYRFGWASCLVGDADGDGRPFDVLIGSLEGDFPSALYLMSILDDGGVSVLAKVTAKSRMFSLALEDLFDSLHMVGFASQNGSVLLVTPGINSEGSGILSVFSVADLSDRDFAPQLEAAVSPTVENIKVSSFENPIPFWLPVPNLVDPHGSDPNRQLLPLVLLTDVANASDFVSVLNISLNGNACLSTSTLPNWPFSPNSRRLGVACIGPPEGLSGKLVDVTLHYQNLQNQAVTKVTSKITLAKYDDLRRPFIVDKSLIASGAVDWTGEEFGASISFAGDVNRDGVADEMVVGTRGGGSKIFVFRLQADLSVTHMHTIDGGLTDACFGCAIGWIGDFDNDGSDASILVGAPDTNQVFLMSLGLDGSVEYQVEISDGVNGGPTLATGAMFGSAVSLVGDVDGDGRAFDVVVGAKGEGVVFVMGVSQEGTVLWTTKIGSSVGGGLASFVQSNGFGGVVCVLGDFDGDGVFADLVFGLPTSSVATTGSFVIGSLENDGTFGDLSVEVYSGSNGLDSFSKGRIGGSIALVGDVDGDGRTTDIAVPVDMSEEDPTEFWLFLLSVEQDATVKVLARVTEKRGNGPKLSLFDQVFGIGSMPRVGGDALERVLFVGVPNHDSDTGVVHVLGLSDATDTSTPPTLRGVSLPSSTAPTTYRSTYSHSVTLDPLASDPQYQYLSIAALTDTFQAADQLTLLDVSIDSRPCESAWIEPNGITTSNTRRVVVVCDGVPEGDNTQNVSISISLESNGLQKSISTQGIVSYKKPTNVPFVTSSQVLQAPTQKVFGASSAFLGQTSPNTFILALGNPSLHSTFIVSYTKDSTTILATIKGQIYSSFGWAVAHVGDLNQNGRSFDLAVGAPTYDAAGAVYLYEIGVDGEGTLFGTLAKSEPGMEFLSNGGQFGRSVDLLDAATIVVGASEEVNGRGAVYVLNVSSDGRATLVERIASESIDGVPTLLEQDMFGSSLSFGGGEDGVLRFFVGAPNRKDKGAVFLFRMDGSDFAMLSEIGSAENGGPLLGDDAQFGRAVTFLGDQNADGMAFDVLVGASNGRDGGMVYLLCADLEGRVVFRDEIGASLNGGPSSPLSLFGTSLAWIGNAAIDDGLFNDVLVGSYNNITNTGALHLLHLSAPVSIPSQDLIVAPPQNTPSVHRFPVSDIPSLILRTSKRIFPLYQQPATTTLNIHHWAIGDVACFEPILLPRSSLPNRFVNDSHAVLISCNLKDLVYVPNITRSTTSTSLVYNSPPHTTSKSTVTTSRLYHPNPTPAITTITPTYKIILRPQPLSFQTTTLNFSMLPTGVESLDSITKTSVFSAVNLSTITTLPHSTHAAWIDIVDVSVFFCTPHPLDVSIVSYFDTLSTPVSIEPIVTLLSAVAERPLANEGGTSIVLEGVSFGTSNLSALTATSNFSDVKSRCLDDWTRAGMAYFDPRASVDLYVNRSKVVFWAFVDDIPCLEVWWIGETSIRCVAPPGIAQNVSVSVTLGGTTGELATSISYDALPVITSIAPSTGLAHDGSSVVAISAPFLELLGREPRPITPSRLIFWPYFEQDDLSTATFVPPSTLGNIPTPPGIGSGIPVSLCVEDQFGTEFCTAIGSNVSYQAPVIESIDPSTDIDPLGGIRMVISGTNFGDPAFYALEPDTLPSVVIGGRECLDVQVLSATEIRCTTGALIGGTQPVHIAVLGSVSSSENTVQVLTVSIIAVLPRNLMPAAPGRRTESFSITVIGAREVRRLFIGGEECLDFEAISDEQLSCNNLPFPSVWTSDTAFINIFGSQRNLSERPVLRVEPPPEVLAVTLNNGAPTTGGVRIIAVGIGFGLEDYDFDSAVVGAQNESVAYDAWSSGLFGGVATEEEPVVLRQVDGLANLTSNAGTSSSILLPVGAGTQVPVRIVTAYGLMSTPFFIDYDPPIIESVRLVEEDPSDGGIALFLPGEESVDVELCGTGFPPRVKDLDEVNIGGVLCDELAVPNIGCVYCIGFSSPSSSNSEVEDWLTNEVSISVRGQVSAEASGLAQFLSPPNILELNPTTAGVGDTVRVIGTALGFDGYIVGVRVGGSEDGLVASETDGVVVGVSWISETEVSFQMPESVGEVFVEVITVKGLVSTSGQKVTYSSPIVTSMDPPVLLPGLSNVSVLLYGANLAPETEYIDVVRIGGLACGGFRAIDSTALECVNLSTPALGELWPSTFVEVIIGGISSGQVVVPDTVFVNPPAINSITPESAGPGDVLRVVGTGFGSREEDVSRVMVGGVACASWSWVSATELECEIPNPHPTWVGVEDSTIVAYVAVEVQLVSGITTDPASETTRFEPDGLRVRPDPILGAQGLAAWRPVGQSGIVVVRWRYPGQALEQDLNLQHIAGGPDPLMLPVATFRVEASTVEDFSDSVSVSAAREASLSRPAQALTDPDESNAWEWHEARVPVFSASPLFVRVRGLNVDGNGPWSQLERGWNPLLGAAVPSTCTEEEYLATQNTFSEVSCLPCPEGAHCAGLTARNVTAKSGYWRIPWSADQLGFALCAIDACVGQEAVLISKADLTSSSGRALANSSIEKEWQERDATDRPVAVSGAYLDPGFEGCIEGHRGVLCSACKPNYFPGVGRICTPCGNRAWIGGRFFLMVVAVLLALSVILARAWATRALRSSKELQIAKILVSHLQSIAIVGAVQLRWPSGAREFFAFADAGSSFTTSGLALECLLGSSSQDPFARTAVILSMPFWLVLYTSFLWIALGHWELRWPWLARKLEGKSEDNEDEEEPALPRKLPSHFSWSVWRTRMLVSSIVVAFLVHTPISSAAFRLLTCRPVHPEDDLSPTSSQLRLDMDLDVNCSNPSDLATMLGMAIPTLLLVSFGIPAGSAILLRTIGKEKLQEPLWGNRLGFLTNGYKKNLYFWESVVLLRKVMLAFVTTTLAPAGGGMQVTTALLVLLAALVFHARFHPYQSNVINSLESFALITASVTLVGGLYVVLENTGNAGTATNIAGSMASTLLVLLNVLFLLVALGLLSRSIRAFARRALARFQERFFPAGEDIDDDDQGFVRRASSFLLSRRASEFVFRNPIRRDTTAPSTFQNDPGLKKLRRGTTAPMAFEGSSKTHVPSSKKIRRDTTAPMPFEGSSKTPSPSTKKTRRDTTAPMSFEGSSSITSRKAASSGSGSLLKWPKLNDGGDTTAPKSAAPLSSRRLTTGPTSVPNLQKLKQRRGTSAISIPNPMMRSRRESTAPKLATPIPPSTISVSNPMLRSRRESTAPKAATPLPAATPQKSKTRRDTSAPTTVSPLLPPSKK